MKKLIIIITLVFGIYFTSFSQIVLDTETTEKTKQASKTRQDSLNAAFQHHIDSIESVMQQEYFDYVKYMQAETKKLPRYKIYQTENIHILLKIDTRIGRVYMIQYASKDPLAVEIPIGPYPHGRVNWGWNGRFELYPTKDMYNFIMIDSYWGEIYRVQWGPKASDRFVQRIAN